MSNLIYFDFSHSFHYDIINRIFNFSNLKNIQNLSQTCKKISLYASEFLKNPQKQLYLKDANKNFFQTFFIFFNIEDIKQFDYRLITRQELNKFFSGLNNHSNELTLLKRTSKFLHSLQNASFHAEQHFKQYADKTSLIEAELALQDCSYAHMWQDKREHFDFLEIVYQSSQGKELKSTCKQRVQQLLEEKYEQTIITTLTTSHKKYSSQKTSHTHRSLSHAYSTCLHLIDDPILQITDAGLVETLYTHFWQQYKITHLNNGRNPQINQIATYTTYMSVPMFKGLCHSIKTSTEKFGRFQTWILTENHLQAWNEAFANRKLESLNIQLVSHITRTTFEKFKQIVLNLEMETEVNITYTSCEHSDSNEINKCFESLEDEMSQKNPLWTLNLATMKQKQEREDE